MPSDNCRCPKGEEGRKVIEEMDRHHEPLIAWALSMLPPVRPGRILDIGCGGGVIIEKMSAMHPDAQMNGVDISMESVRATSRRNARLIEEGRLKVDIGSVSDLPYEKEHFDLITAVETYYFWPELESDVKAAASRLRQGGTMMIAAETYVRPDLEEQNARYTREFGVRIVSNEYMIEIMENAGMDSRFEVKEDKGWVVFIGGKR